MKEEENKVEAALAPYKSQHLRVTGLLVKRGLREITVDTIRTAHDQAFDLYKKGQFGQGIQICDMGLRYASTDDILLQIKGICLAEQGKYNDALECFDQALKEEPTNPYCWCIKASYLSLIGRHSEAAECNARAIELAPNDTDLQKRRNDHLAAWTTAQQGDEFDWRAALVANVAGWHIEPATNRNSIRYLHVILEAENISEIPRLLTKTMVLFHRVPASGEMSVVGEAVVVEFSPYEALNELILSPRSGANRLEIEIGLKSVTSKSDQESFEELFATPGHDLVGVDQKSGTIILFLFDVS